MNDKIVKPDCDATRLNGGDHSIACELAMETHCAPAVQEKAQGCHDMFVHVMAEKKRVVKHAQTCAPAVQEITCNAQNSTLLLSTVI
eukprot:3019968-Karenia_brevis.AAC.1